MSQHREVVTALGAPKPAGPYSHAIRAGGLLFCAGQIGLDPASGELGSEGPGDQARTCLRNLDMVCAAAGAKLGEDAVKLTVYVTDMESMPAVNEAYADFFGDDPPARVGIGVAALPKGAKVEIDAVVALPD